MTSYIQRPEEGVRPHRDEITGGWWQAARQECWEPKPGPLKEQHTLLTIKPSLYP